MAKAERYAAALELQILPGQEIAHSGGKLLVQCLTCKTVYEKRYNGMQSGKGCWKCGKKRAARKQQLSESKLIQACTFLGHQFISRSGSGTHTKVLYKCRFGVQHAQSQGSIVARKGCGCGATSSYEHAIRSRFEFATGYQWSRISKRELCDLTGAKDAPKEIDLFCRELGIAVEVDGGFHRPPKHERSGWHANIYPRVVRADAARDSFVTLHKDKLARHSGPQPLIRINTDEMDLLTQDGLNEFVGTLLAVHGIKIANDLTGFTPPPNASRAQYGTARNRAAAEAKGCRYPDQPYLGVNAKHRFECGVHGEFEMRAAQMRASGGCPKCGWRAAAVKRLGRRKELAERASQLL